MELVITTHKVNLPNEILLMDYYYHTIKLCVSGEGQGFFLVIISVGRSNILSEI